MTTNYIYTHHYCLVGQLFFIEFFANYRCKRFLFKLLSLRQSLPILEIKQIPDFVFASSLIITKCTFMHV